MGTNATIHYTDDNGKLRSVKILAFHPDEIVWIGARKAKMDKDKFRKSIIQVDTEEAHLLK